VARILEAVVGAVTVPVTLKIRTGWDPSHRNAPAIARIAEEAGVKAITVHGRTRACGFSGQAEYRTIRAVKDAVSIPVIANGDIDSPGKAAAVLAETGADAVMVGRAALGRPWIFRTLLAEPGTAESGWTPDERETRGVILEHLHDLYGFYGEPQGVRIARKHLGWYLDHLPHPLDFMRSFHAETTAAGQLALAESLF
jgi:tRNA-dihydrouridine synthase B